MDYLENIYFSSLLVGISPLQIVMLVLGFGLMCLSVQRPLEPSLLLPLGFAVLVSNIPGLNVALSSLEAALQGGDYLLMTEIAAALGMETADPQILMQTFSEADVSAQQKVLELVSLAGYEQGPLYVLYEHMIANGIAPMLIFLGIGAMMDCSALLARPKLILLGLLAQIAIFITLFAMAALSAISMLEFSTPQTAVISLLASGDGALVVFAAHVLAPEMLALISVAAYTCIALLPLLQRPILLLMTTRRERQIVMPPARFVSRAEKLVFIFLLLLLCLICIPFALPMVGMFCLGNIFRESGATERLAEFSRGPLLSFATLVLALGIGSQLRAETLFDISVLAMLGLGFSALSLSTLLCVIAAKLLNLISGSPLNPLIGAAAVSAVPMSAHTASQMALQQNKNNRIITDAMGASIAGFVTSALIAGIFFSYF